uniref:Uncharacterized protein n=1 Tax=Amphora coffeiformis TaxID=265554 RepID=A0A7S3P9X8_9STRA|mmetsp:Transcript_13280/g.25154  ORF Transcript_13280/g.25154 Transcript_13280/m.25154 type:complete len:852 (+) Transcript_13280:283-2838(+)
MAAWNDTAFELFGQVDLEHDDILSCTGQTVNTDAPSAPESMPPLTQSSACDEVSAASSARKRRGTTMSPTRAPKRSQPCNISLTSSGDARGDAPPSFVSVTSSSRAARTTSMTAVSTEHLPDGTRLIPDWYAVLGDKQSGGRGRTTTATSLLRDVKEWYKESKPFYRDEGRLHALMDDALERYFGAVAEAFPTEFPTDMDARKETILIYCSKEALQSGRVAEPNCFTYEAGKPPKFGLATVPAALSFFLESRDAPSLPSVVRKLRRDFDALRNVEGAAPAAMLAHFEGLLQFCEMQLQAAASQEMAQKLLDKLNLIPALREQWKFLKEHAAANGKTIPCGGPRSVASTTASRQAYADDEDEGSASRAGRGGAGGGSTGGSKTHHRAQGKKTALSRKAAAQRMKARQPHEYRTFQNANGSPSYGPFVTMQSGRIQDEQSDCTGSDWSSSYWSGHPSVVSEQTNRGAPSPYARTLDEESLTDVDGWQQGRQREEMDDDEGSYQIGGIHRTMGPNNNIGGEINVMRSFHDSASAVSAVSSVTAATAMMRMEEDDKSSASSTYQQNPPTLPQQGGPPEQESWNQRALSKLRLHSEDTSSVVGMDDSGQRFAVGVTSSSGDSVTSASRRSRARQQQQQQRRTGRRRAHQQGPPPAPMQPVADVYHVTTISVVDPHGDHGLYTGSISNESGMPHGFGRFEFLKGGRWYEGNWVHGHWTGKGKLSNGDGSHYDGGFQDDLKHGQGTMVWGDGRVFDGIYKHGQMTWGKMRFADGGTYFGNFCDGLQHGKGNMVFADNSKYEGDFENGNFHGVGKMVWNDGGYYEGEWKEGMIHGKGKEIRADGTLRHEGNWRNGAPVR